MQKHHNQTPTISQFAQNKAKKLSIRVTIWGILCFIVIALIGSSFYHYTEIKKGMSAVNKGLSQTLGLGGDFIPKQIMKGAISAGNFEGFWIYDNKGNLITKRAILNSLNPREVNSTRIEFHSAQPIIFTKAPLVLNNERIGLTVSAYRIPVYPILSLIFVVSAIITLIAYFLNSSIYELASDIARPIVEITNDINGENKKFIENKKKWNLLEIDQLYETFKEYLKESKKAEESVRLAMVGQQLASIAYKVKHDIKASLYIAENNLNKIPNELSYISTKFKSIFDRICNIADDIPQFEEFQRLQLKTEEEGAHHLRSCHIASIVNEIVNEFSTSNLDGKDIKFQTQYKRESFHSYCKVDITKFKRTLVNLIKNSIEAIPSKGKVNLLLSNDDDFLYLSIKDNGIGMTEKQLKKTGLAGVTFKKDGGSGLGVSSSIENIKNWKGELKIESANGKGTTVKVLLPLSEENLLLPTQVFIEPNTEVIVADDDPLYLDLYREKFSSDNFKTRGINFTFTDNTKTVEKKLTQLAKENKKFFLLSDQNFGEKEKCGLDIIKDFGAIEKSILISSDGTSPRFLKECEELGVPMISKSIAKDVVFMAIG